MLPDQRRIGRLNQHRVGPILRSIVQAVVFVSTASVADLIRADQNVEAEVAGSPRIIKEFARDHSIYTVDGITLHLRSTPRTVPNAQGKLEFFVELDVDDVQCHEIGLRLLDHRPESRRELEHRLDLLVAYLADQFELSSAQEEKVWLAGRGDIRRIGQRLDRIKERLKEPILVESEDSLETLKWIADLAKDATEMRSMFEENPFAEGSFLDKVLRRQLTPNQMAEYDQQLLKARLLRKKDQ